MLLLRRPYPYIFATTVLRIEDDGDLVRVIFAMARTDTKSGERIIKPAACVGLTPGGWHDLAARSAIGGPRVIH